MGPDTETLPGVDLGREASPDEVLATLGEVAENAITRKLNAEADGQVIEQITLEEPEHKIPTMRELKEARRPKLRTTGTPGETSSYIQMEKSGAFVNTVKDRIRLVCKTLGINKKQYRKMVKDVKRDMQMTEVFFQERVLGLAEEKAKSGS